MASHILSQLVLSRFEATEVELRLFKAEKRFLSRIETIQIADAVDFNGKTPLHHASNGMTFELLSENGADIDAEDDKCRTPLYLAIRLCNTDIVKLLSEQ